MAKAKRTILVVDDNAIMRDGMVTVLSKRGYSALTAKNGAEAIEVAESTAPDLILMDLGMPVMDGFEAIAKLKAGNDTSKIPVIIVSAMDRERERALAAGCDGFIKKPVDLVRLDQMIIDSVGIGATDS